MQPRQWLITLVALALIVAAIVGSFITRDLGSSALSAHLKKTGQPAPLVDEQPLKTARAMAKLASSPDEQRVSDQAVEAADHEVDIAFHDASRDAADHPAVANPKNKALYDHASEAEAQVKNDQDSVGQLKKQLASAPVTRQDALQEQLDVAQAQLELDQDELDDAKEDLMRAGADPGAMIQHQFEQHQATEHSGDDKTVTTSDINTTAPEINYQAGSLLAQFSNWRALKAKQNQLQTARDEAVRSAATLTQAHDSLEKQVSSEKAQRRATASGNGPSSAGPSSGSRQPPSGAAVKSLHLLSDNQKDLSDFDQRIQDENELRSTYESWIGLVQSHQRSAVHGMIQSWLWILLIFLVVYLTDHAIGRYLADANSERTRLHTLRTVIRFTLQAIGALLVLFVIFGAPSQTPTILGLAGAGLTVAMKDFIVAFFGWFVLMGRNGMRVGDWVEINGVAGQVVEINLLRTVLLETGNWTDTGHPTGRKVAFVNSFAIEGHFFNFSTVGQWLWDEIEIVVPSAQNPYPIIEAIQKLVTEETAASAKEAEQEWAHATTRYRVHAVSAVPAVNLRPTAAGVEVHVRYITRANERYATRARLYQALVGLLRGGENVPDATVIAK